MSKILWLDDHATSVPGYMKSLKQAGHEVHPTSDIPAFISELKSGQYDLLIVDLLLPDVGDLQLDLKRRILEHAPPKGGLGEALIGYIRQELRLHVPIVVLSICADDADVKDRLETLVIAAFVEKDVLADERLRGVVEETLGRIDLVGPTVFYLRSELVEERRIGLQEARRLLSYPIILRVLKEMRTTEVDTDLLATIEELLAMQYSVSPPNGTTIPARHIGTSEGDDLPIGVDGVLSTRNHKPSASVSWASQPSPEPPYETENHELPPPPGLGSASAQTILPATAADSGRRSEATETLWWRPTPQERRLVSFVCSTALLMAIWALVNLAVPRVEPLINLLAIIVVFAVILTLLRLLTGQQLTDVLKQMIGGAVEALVNSIASAVSGKKRNRPEGP